MLINCIIQLGKNIPLRIKWSSQEGMVEGGIWVDPKYISGKGLKCIGHKEILQFNEVYLFANYAWPEK